MIETSNRNPRVVDPWKVPDPPLPPPPPPPDVEPLPEAVAIGSTAVDVIYYVVLMQGGMAVASAIAAMIGAAAFGFLTAPVALATLGAAIVTLLLARGIRRRSRRARRFLIWAEISVIAFGVIDLLLALFLADRGLGLVGTLTRIVLPFLVIRYLRKPQARLEFGVPPKVKKARRRRWRRS